MEYTYIIKQSPQHGHCRKIYIANEVVILKWGEMLSQGTAAYVSNCCNRSLLLNYIEVFLYMNWKSYDYCGIISIQSTFTRYLWFWIYKFNTSPWFQTFLATIIKHITSNNTIVTNMHESMVLWFSVSWHHYYALAILQHSAWT